MSRKLLMNNHTVNGLMPVMNGLVCWLDARDLKQGDTVWKDRSGNGNNFTISNVVFGSSMLILGNTSRVQGMVNGIDLSRFNIEIYHKLKAPLNTHGFIETFPKLIEFYENDSKNLIVGYISSSDRRNIEYSIDGVSSDIFTPTDNLAYIAEKRCLNINTNYTQLQGIAYDESKKTVFNRTIVAKTVNYNKVIIGNRHDLIRPFIGEIYSIKIYNTPLTEEEIKQNYAYEQSIIRG